MSAIPTDISMITGPTMVGICLNWGFMGVLVAQLYFYHENCSGDSRTIKALVYGLALLDILQTVMVTADAFHWFVYGFGNMTRLDQTFLNSWDVPVLDAIISLVVQAFYCWRIHLVREALVIPILILAVSVTQCVAGIWTGVRAHQLGHLSLIDTEVVPQTIWLVGAAVADVAIAVVLAWALLYQRSCVIPSSRTHSLISRVIRLIVETNALTAGVAVIALILFWGVPQHSTLVVPPTAIIGKLYTNSFLALFNNRLKDVKPMSGHGMQSVHLPQSSQQRQEDRTLKVHVVREMELDYGQIELGNVRKPDQSFA
ncbi:hypothetical protein MSAN_00617800 [Mycena sanguinolenta]|uniref:DUF6534 domain-containing protein n=1 Tax=Mycena sanguinolenta TaxID=230812 RepID=A0A8H6Z2R6_9AGAR|nr:hypothetical protein MSAN_00617800 [Mycena sanguinolenta]